MELRDLPSVDSLRASVADDYPWLPDAIVVGACRDAIDEARSALRSGDEAEPEDIVRERLDRIDAARPRRVINATGVLLHTNLGRAPAHHRAVAHLAGFASHAGNVELDVRTGRRASRHEYLAEVLRAATGAEDGFAVNNNAGALLLALGSIGEGARIAVSRGELIEIGGSFRLPELMRASGATLVEVGTTNRTRTSDFVAVADRVDAILKVHPSNYRIEGFQEEATAEDLAALAAERHIPFIHDVGSGLLDEAAPWLGDAPRAWLDHEPGVNRSVGLGTDLVLFSGDKLLGGPQAGVIVGRTAAVEAARRHPIARAVRLDGGTIASLSATLELYVNRTVLAVPFWRMAAATVEEIDRRSRDVAVGFDAVTVVDAESIPGAGSVPGRTIPTRALRIDGPADAIWSALASDDEDPVIGVRRDGSLFLDLRSVLPEDDHRVRATLDRALS